ncbi:facilitated trehalose transporter Tret1-like isoform X2 [Wyeomyia smithii]|uniref:facilitated trehalose transporter Tret1-like isoform X2 n=1 Tax=Wyeomyia smithii TaxID=174621 RepID=UPI002467D051|nr:facilitated trehalose transporter Tret1-like isoform X2 [Wyeomyia smithii]
MKHSSSARNQYLATFCVNLLSINYGFACGWTSPSFALLQSVDTPLSSGPITTEEGSWIGASICVGGLFGTLISGWMSERYGRKLTACLASIPQILSWIMVIVADNAYYLMAMRFLGGFSGGVCFMVIPTFIAEISEDRIRGMLASTLVLSCNFGILLVYILGNYLPYATIPWIMLLFPIAFIASFSFIPDTPFYLMRKNDFARSENALRFFRGYCTDTQQVSNEFKLELVKLQDTFSDEKQSIPQDEITWADLSSRHARKAFLIGICLMAFNQFCGCFAMLNYTASVFAESGSSLTANMSAIVIGTIQMFGSYFSTVLVERAGRKVRPLGGLRCFGNVPSAVVGSKGYVNLLVNCCLHGAGFEGFKAHLNVEKRFLHENLEKKNYDSCQRIQISQYSDCSVKAFQFERDCLVIGTLTVRY